MVASASGSAKPGISPESASDSGTFKVLGVKFLASHPAKYHLYYMLLPLVSERLWKQPGRPDISLGTLRGGLSTVTPQIQRLAQTWNLRLSIPLAKRVLHPRRLARLMNMAFCV